jgi:site-specific DNA-methyltransferase (adenine-specific)
MGSGSTGRACAIGGFRFVGIERDPAYLPIARARIADARGPLFANPPAA